MKKLAASAATCWGSIRSTSPAWKPTRKHVRPAWQTGIRGAEGGTGAPSRPVRPDARHGMPPGNWGVLHHPSAAPSCSLDTKARQICLIADYHNNHELLRKCLAVAQGALPSNCYKQRRPAGRSQPSMHHRSGGSRICWNSTVRSTDSARRKSSSGVPVSSATPRPSRTRKKPSFSSKRSAKKHPQATHNCYAYVADGTSFRNSPMTASRAERRENRYWK